MQLTAIIEIPAGSIHKYEQDKSTGELVLDRPLNQPVPHNYGFIPGTLCDDGDALDVFVLTDTPIYPLSKVKVNIIGVLKCTDNGKSDDKIIATLVGDCSGYETMGTSIIKHYLETYKTGFTVNSQGETEEALKVYEDSVALLEKHKKNSEQEIHTWISKHHK